MPSPAFSAGHFHQNNMQEDAVVGCLFYLSLVKKNGEERGKLADKFTPCSITVAPASVPSLATEESWSRVNINNM